MNEADRTRKAFLANLRHELRTPLNAVIGYSEMLLEDVAEEGPEELSPDLKKVRAAGVQLLALVNAALDPARIETGADFENIGVDLRYELRTPITTVVGYSEMLLEEAEDLGAEQVVPDLRKIQASAERFLSLMDDVADFSRIEAGEAASHLEAVSEMVRDAVMVEGPSRETGVRADHNPLLIVDDNEINRDVLARQLGRQGHATAVAENGRRALEMVRERDYDLMLLDIMMPEMNGYEVLRRLKADARSRDIPVVMISALDEVETVVRCIELGAEDYLPKPFDPVLLRARIGACLEKKRLRDAEVEYLRNVSCVTAAAAEVEAGEFDAETLEEVAGRPDELGQLARVFRRMAREVYAREQRLKQEVRQLRIEIDETRTARQVAEITETDYFRDLQKKANRLRLRTDDA